MGCLISLSRRRFGSESNAAMIHLYEKLGFEVRCITGYYDEPVERAVVFDLSIAGAS